MWLWHLKYREKNAQIRLVKYYTLGEKEKYATGFYESIKVEYPKVFFYSLVYVAGEGFWLGIRSNAKEEPEQVTWKAIMEQILRSVRTEDEIVWQEVYCNYIEE